MTPRLRLWIPGVACLIGGVVGRVALSWYGMWDGRLSYARVALWQLVWYGLGWCLIAAHLWPSESEASPSLASNWAWWMLWVAGVFLSGAAVLSSCPP
jgi:hypothetical protein